MVVLSLIVSFGFLAGYYALCLYGFQRGGGLAVLRTLNRKTLIATVLICSMILIFVIWEISQNKFIYYWDYRQYWTNCIDFMQHLYADVPTALDELARSISDYDYNFFLPAISSLPLKVFGYTYMRYITLNAAMFLVPALITQSALIVKVVARKFTDKPDVVFIVALLLLALFPFSYRALLNGYIDVASLMPMSILVLLAFHYDLGRKRCKEDIIIPVLLVLIVLLRRYNAFFVVGYAVLMIALAIRAIVKAATPEQRKRLACAAVRHYAFMAALGVAILVVFFPEFVQNTLFRDYAFAYSAYDAPLADKIQTLVFYYGWYSLILIGLGIFFSFFFKRNRTIVCMSIVLACVAVAAFFQVQSMGMQHVNLIWVQVTLLVIVGIFFVFDLCCRRWMRLIPLAVLIVYAFNMFYVYVPQMRNQAVTNSHFFAQAYSPKTRDDIPVLRELVSYLNSLYKEDGLRTYVCAGGDVLNADIVRQIDLPHKQNALEGQLHTADIDLRDGFPSDFLKANVVVATDPIQGTQEVLHFLAQETMDQASPIGKHFKLIKEFELGDGVKALVYLKTSQFSGADLEFIRAHFASVYPGQEELFDNRIVIRES